MIGKVQMGFFLYDFQNGKVGGAICKSEMHKPSQEGSLIYLNCQPDLQTVLDRVENAGGKIVQQKIKISEEQNLGFWALIRWRTIDERCREDPPPAESCGEDARIARC